MKRGSNRYVETRNLYFSSRPLPFSADREAPDHLAGDWDLGASRAFDVLGIRAPAASLFPPPGTTDEAFVVVIGRHGDVVAARTPELEERLRERGAWLPVRIIGRHDDWQAFRDEIEAFSAGEEGGLVYAPLTHVDLQDIPSWNGPERLGPILAHISPTSETVLDIGAHWGYMCEQLEKTGRRCTAVEVDPTCFHLMTKLRRAQGFSYATVQESIFDYVRRQPAADTVLSLAVFHHFVKTERDHCELVELLQQLEMKEMFFWAHNPHEPQMQSAFRNYQPDDFARFIVRHSCLERFDPIGEFEYRTLYWIR
ncbi:class I SAM-dependent methyltransferase [Sorangium sp. So ce1128]